MTMKAITVDGAPGKQNSVPSFLQNLRNYFNEYCTHTSIHGLKFLGERRRSIFERLWWFLIIMISLFYCTHAILEMYKKWNESPVVVSFSTTETPVWKIPFPAVTICPQIKTRKYLVNYTDLVQRKRNNEILTENELKQLKFMFSICPYGKNLLHYYDNSETLDDKELTEFLMENRPLLSSVIKNLRWTGEDVTANMENILRPIITADGVCYSFNLIYPRDLYRENVVVDHYNIFAIPPQRSSQWSIEKGYPLNLERDDLNTYPRRSAVSGGYGGLDITLSFNISDMDYLCSDSLEGFKVIINNPIQKPFVNNIYFQVGINKDVTVAVTPNVISTSKQLSHYKPDQRECYFQEEIKLKFFKVYDQQNCYHECVANFTLNQCNCVMFTSPRDNSTPVCGPGKASCLKKTHDQFLARQVKSDPKEKLCNCYPSCDSLSFETEISQCDWNWQEQDRLTHLNASLRSNGLSLTKLHIFYNKQQFISSERHELFGQMDFLASCGGLLGLFIGFSFISVMEIVYFLTMRFACNVKNFGKDYWAGREIIPEKQTSL